jgi:hypothetical protein
MTIRTYGGYLPLTGGTLTGVLGLPAGSITAPSLNFGDVQTGFLKGSGTNILAATVNGTKVFEIYSGGFALGTNGINWASSVGGTIDARITRTAAGVFLVTDTTNGINIDVTGNSLRAKNAANNADVPVIGLYLKSGTTTVGALPAAATAGAGARYMVTDANSTTFMSTVAAGGANVVPVVSDGTNWKIA